MVTATDTERFTGKLIERGAEGYDAARLARIFHSRHPARYPAAVLLAESERDIVEGVRLAAERGWQVGVRSGGHSFPVWGLRDEGLLIDLGGYKELAYDARTQVVTATPSVTGGDELNPFLAEHGRFFGGGACPSVGLGGFLLQGGIGWNFRGWGFAAEQIVAVDVVTADGELVRADATQNEDLYWAVRGAGPGYCAVVTRFHLETRPVPAGLAATTLVYPMAVQEDVLEWVIGKNREISDAVHLVCSSLMPPFPTPDGEGGFVFAVWAVAFCDTPEESAAALAPLLECPHRDRALLVEDAKPTTVAEQHAFVGASHPEGLRYRVDSAWVEGSAGELVAASRTIVQDRPRHEAGHTFFQFGLPREGPDMAMTLQTDIVVGAYVIYADEADDELYREWSLRAMGELEPYTVGQYWGDSDQQHREVKCLTDAAWTRLQEIRDRRDPGRRFADYLAPSGGFRNVNGWEA